MPHHLLSHSNLTIISAEPDHELARLHTVLERKLLVDGRMELEERLSDLLETRALAAPKTLDLVGHSTPSGLLELGRWVIDRKNPTVTAFFRELADLEVLPRLGVTAVRLLGCGTATTERGRDTITTLAEILGLPVLGSTGLVHARHFTAQGFDPAWEFLLVGPDDLLAPTPALSVAPPVRTLDIDFLPAVALGVSAAWPRHVATPEQARAFLSLVRRTEGAAMPGLLATPMSEVAVPAHDGLHHVLQLMLEGQFVRVYPRDGGDGLLYPVRDPEAMRELITQLR